MNMTSEAIFSTLSFTEHCKFYVLFYDQAAIASVTSKFAGNKPITVICQQQIYRVFAIDRRLSPAILPSICYWQIVASVL